MNTLGNLIARVILGLLLGAAVVFIVLACGVGYAFFSGQQLVLPGLLEAWFTTENGLPALNFRPQFTGMAIAVAAVALLFVLFGRSRHGNARPV